MKETKSAPNKRMKRLRLGVKFGTRKRAEGPRKIVRNCGVRGSRSSRKEKDRSEEGQEEDLRNKKDSQISGLLLVGFGVRKLRNLGTSFRRTHA
jgi:hypothetical protein